MDRMACVNVPCILIQILLREHPEWRSHPTAVVTEDKPLGTIVETNRAARQAGIRPGMRYSTALSLISELRAGVISQDTVSAGRELMFKRFTRFSPEIEPSRFEPGIFWLNADGLTRLFSSLSHWTTQIETDLNTLGFSVRIAVGFTRFGTFAAAKTTRASIIFLSREEERTYCMQTPLTILPLSHKTLARLRNLGVCTIAAFLRLPRHGVRLRFGSETERLYLFASDDSTVPLQPARLREEMVLEKLIPHETTNRAHLLPSIEEMLDRLLEDAKEHDERIREISLALHTENDHRIIEMIRPAEPTTQRTFLVQLIGLRLENVALTTPVVRIKMSAERIVTADAQLNLFRAPSRRNLAEGARAFALIRAELGNDAVQIARVAQEHLPERQFEWTTMDRPVYPKNEPDSPPQWKLVRRVFPEAVPLLPVHAESLLANHRGGPYVVAAEWWKHDTEREYHFVETKRGRILWIYHDRLRSCWMVQGFVE